MHSPTVVVIAGLMDDERTMSGLLPVARIASPIRVRRNSVKNRTISAAAARAVRSLYCPASGVPASADFIRENTVCVLLRLSSDAPPIMAMLIEYSAVFTMMPANRLLMPMRVCKTETISPDSGHCRENRQYRMPGHRGDCAGHRSQREAAVRGKITDVQHRIAQIQRQYGHGADQPQLQRRLYETENTR